MSPWTGNEEKLFCNVKSRVTCCLQHFPPVFNGLNVSTYFRLLEPFLLSLALLFYGLKRVISWKETTAKS
jgi:hypothetical protein